MTINEQFQLEMNQMITLWYSKMFCEIVFCSFKKCFHIICIRWKGRSAWKKMYVWVSGAFRFMMLLVPSWLIHIWCTLSSKIVIQILIHPLFLPGRYRHVFIILLGKYTEFKKQLNIQMVLVFINSFVVKSVYYFLSNKVV